MEVKNKFVTILGEVGSPGKYPLRANMTLEDLIPLAGGYTESAEQLKAEVARVTRIGAKGDSLVTLLHPALPTVFDRADAKGNSDSISIGSLSARGQFLLQHRDQIVIWTDPNYKLQQNVSIEGDIRYPGMYALQRRGEMLSDLIVRAGGPTPTSYLGGAEFLRKGQRLLIDFEKALKGKGAEHDVIMLSGDRIVVPSRPHTVQVSGEVNKPGLLAYLEGESVGDYIDRAGGLTDSSNYAVLTSPTGESRRVNFGFLRSNPTVLEGSSIAVTKVPPPKEGKEADITGTVKDIFAILTGAATVAFIVWQTTK
jgi:protein involved in polysaccharide export with SLBB domain